jgi:basic membrane lipoprotein Med (substrate-binding protein (PBP1-ABC) superfamily)
MWTIREDAEYLGREQMGHFLAGIAAAAVLI